MNEFALLLAATLNAGTVLAIAGLGLLINERAGVLNLGAEGMMLVAAIAGTILIPGFYVVVEKLTKGHGSLGADVSSARGDTRHS